MKKLLAAAALDRAAKDVGVREVPVESNLGKRVEEYQRNAGVTPPQPYCASGVFTWYKEGAEALGIKNPVVRTGYCPDLYNWGKSLGLLISPSVSKPGDIILYWHASMGRMAHTGIVRENLGNNKLVTVEANTNASGARNGDGVYQKVRAIGPHDICINMQGWGVEVAEAPAPPAFLGVKVFDKDGREMFEKIGLPVRAEQDVKNRRLIIRVG